MAIGVWAEKAGTLENACGEIDPACLVEQAGTPWADIDGSSDWGSVRLGLADPDTGISDQEAWKLIAAQNPSAGFGQFVPLKQTTDGNVLADMVLFPSRADIVVGSEVAIASQLENAPGGAPAASGSTTPIRVLTSKLPRLAAAVPPRTSSKASPHLNIRPSSVAWGCDHLPEKPKT